MPAGGLPSGEGYDAGWAACCTGDFGGLGFAPTIVAEAMPSEKSAFRIPSGWPGHRPCPHSLLATSLVLPDAPGVLQPTSRPLMGPLELVDLFQHTLWPRSRQRRVEIELLGVVLKRFQIGFIDLQSFALEEFNKVMFLLQVLFV
ncbi:hypothetical protein SAMN06265370_12910 [Puniceibacterium sediminis]|uniref:Uncharacterized protein n=1 Tax=Puniceibacterium sediminis TaxID=1608407 RepID=A0A238ZCT8_9RHOB|nr:hypothetical protein SAMN06265370_12910 [Puniceibacterium sediminis]